MGISSALISLLLFAVTLYHPVRCETCIANGNAGICFGAVIFFNCETQQWSDAKGDCAAIDAKCCLNSPPINTVTPVISPTQEPASTNLPVVTALTAVTSGPLTSASVQVLTIPPTQAPATQAPFTISTNPGLISTATPTTGRCGRLSTVFRFAESFSEHFSGFGSSGFGLRDLSKYARSHDRVKRIVGGQLIGDGDLCYQVAVMYQGNVVATGALISDNYVVTSYSSIARYNANASAFKLLLGGRGKIDAISPNGNLGYSVTKLIPAPNFNRKYGPGFPINDVALLQFDTMGQPLDSSSCKICMPSGQSREYRATFASGYGSQSEQAPTGDGNLRKVKLPLIPKAVCQNVFRTIFPRDFVFDANSMCAGGEVGKDTCNRDGGAPLVGETFEGDRYLIGVANWGYGCAREGYPGVYTNITGLLPWIGQQTSYSS